VADASRPTHVTPKPASQFKKDLRRQGKRGKDLDKLRAVIEALCAGEPLEHSHKDHALTCDWKGWRDCHIEPDWTLLYAIE
jgi:mRNA interferase YafQ